MLKQHTTRDQVGFYLILAALLALTFWLVRPYLDIIAFSLMTVVIVKPLYDRILRWVRGRAGIAVMLTLVAIAVAVIVPLWLAMNVISSQLTDLVALVRQPGGIEEITAKISAALTQRFGEGAKLPPELQQQLNGLAVSVATWLAGRVVNLGMAIPDLISRLFIFIGILGTLLPNYDVTVQRIKQLSPLDDRIDAIFLRKIKLTIWAMFLAIFVIAVVQGLIMGVFIWLAGVPFTSLWTLIAIVAAMLPLGASLVALPLGGVQLLLGNYTSGVIVLAGYLLVVSNLDSFIRPRLVPKEANLNFVMVLLSALGGYQLFGFFGVVYGPVLMIMLLTALEVYQQEYAGTTPAAPGEPPDVAAAEALPVSEPAPAAAIPSGVAAASELTPSEPAPAAPANQSPPQPDAWLLDALSQQPQAAALGESLAKASPAPSD